MDKWVSNLPAEQKKLFKIPKFGFYAVKGKGEGGVCLYLKKSRLLWLYRKIIFKETNEFVMDQEGYPIVYNHIENLKLFMEGELRYNHSHEMSDERHIEYWEKEGFTERQVIDDPELVIWPYSFVLQFRLESPTGLRKVYIKNKALPMRLFRV